MKKRSKQNNPEQKTRNGRNTEFGSELDVIEKAKKKYENSGGQRKKSKHHIEESN